MYVEYIRYIKTIQKKGRRTMRPYKKIEVETAEEKQQKEILQKFEYLICKSLKGNMTTKNIIKLYDIQQELDERHKDRRRNNARNKYTI